MKTYEITVRFTVLAEQDCDAESNLEYALNHAPLLGAQNQIPSYELDRTDEAEPDTK